MQPMLQCVQELQLLAETQGTPYSNTFHKSKQRRKARKGGNMEKK